VTAPGAARSAWGRRTAARLNPGRLLAPLPALALPVITANNIDEKNTVMLESMRPANDDTDT